MKSKMNPCCDKEFQDDSCASGPGSNSRVKETRRLSQRDEPGGTGHACYLETWAKLKLFSLGHRS